MHGSTGGRYITEQVSCLMDLINLIKQQLRILYLNLAGYKFHAMTAVPIMNCNCNVHLPSITLMVGQCLSKLHCKYKIVILANY